LPLVFPDTKEVLIAEVVSAAMGIIVTGLLLYGAHNVSSVNNRTDYIDIKFMQYVLI
jgi:hypothetical protein